MGQYWKLFNLDKMENTHLGAAKMGEFFYANYNKLFINALLGDKPDHKFWAGDRIILLGDYAEGLPAGVVTSEDSTMLRNCSTSDRVYDLLTYKSSLLDGVQDVMKEFPAETSYILRNFSKKEYVHSRTVAEYRQYRGAPPGLSQALFTLIGWSDDPSCALYYNTDAYTPADRGGKTPLHRGSWAGNRLDIVVYSDEVQQTLKDEQWKDISTETARHVSNVYTSVGQQEEDMYAQFERMRRQQLRSEMCCTQ